MKQLIKRLLPLAIIACLAVGLVAGTASAAGNGSGVASVSKAKKAKRGPRGKRGATGATGATGKTGATGPKGDRGEPGPLVEVLPSGRTERGFYDFAGTRASGGGKFVPVYSISFQIPLSALPTVETIAVSGTPTANCPGNLAEPKAAPGFLCIYERVGPVSTFQDSSFGKNGLEIYTGAAEGANYEITGTWATTAK